MAKDDFWNTFGTQLYAYACPIPVNSERPYTYIPYPNVHPNVFTNVIETQPDNAETIIEKCKARIKELDSIIEKSQAEKEVLEKMLEITGNK